MSSADAPRSAAAKLWMFRLVAVVGVPLLLLNLVELGLRAVGAGHDTSLLHEVEIDGRSYLRDNPAFYTLFFPEHLLPRQLPVLVPKNKAETELRIALLGGSAAQGIPEPAFGMAVMLEEQLRHRHPGVDVEVINLANTAINSHVVRKIAEGIEPLDLDAIVVYLGNNEVVGPFGAGTVFTLAAPPRWKIDLTLWLRSMRLGQLLGGLFAPSAGAPERWRGMEMFVEQSVRADDPSLDRVRDHYRRNLEAIVAVGQRLKIPVILSTVAVNLRHCAPFAGESALEGDRRARFDQSVAQGDQAWQTGELEAASRIYEQASELDSDAAELQYRIGRLQLAMADTTVAAAHLAAVLEHDALRFRADAAINAIIRALASREGVGLADVETAIRAQSPGGLPGRESFFEHVHFDLRGNAAAARTIGSALESVSVEGLGPARVDSWLSPDQLSARTGYTVVERFEVLSQVGKLLLRPPFTAQTDQAEQLARIRGELQSVSQAIPADALMSLWPQYEASIAAQPSEWVRRFRAATFLTDKAGEAARAEAMWRQLVAELSHFPAAANGLARSLVAQSKFREAITWIERSLELDPHQPAASINLAAALRRAFPHDGDARQRALKLDERALRAEVSREARTRLEARYQEDATWWEKRGESKRAEDLRTRARELDDLD